MPMHKLLARQIKKLLQGVDENDQQLKPFFEAISKAYDDYDADNKLLERTIELSSKELVEANDQLREQLKKQQTVLEDLKAALSVLAEDDQDVASDDLTFLSSKLVKLIAEHSQAEEQLKARTQEMELINKVMIGRELKMIELKKQIIKLSKNGALSPEKKETENK